MDTNIANCSFNSSEKKSIVKNGNARISGLILFLMVVVRVKRNNALALCNAINNDNTGTWPHGKCWEIVVVFIAIILLLPLLVLHSHPHTYFSPICILTSNIILCL